jgi:hypothetical protein
MVAPVKVDFACSVGVHMAQGRTWDVLFRSRVSSCGEAESRRAHDDREESYIVTTCLSEQRRCAMRNKHAPGDQPESRPRALRRQVRVQQPGRLLLRTRHPYRSSVIVIDEWPMNVDSAFALQLAAIIKLANVWRHSCSPIPSSPAAFHAAAARFLIAPSDRGAVADPPNARPSTHGQRSRCAARWARSTAGIGTDLTPALDFGATVSPDVGS